MNYEIYNIINAGKENVSVEKLGSYHGKDIYTDEGEMDFYNNFIAKQHSDLINFKSLIIIVNTEMMRINQRLSFIPVDLMEQEEIDNFEYKTEDGKYCIYFDIAEHDERYDFYEGYYNTYDEECPYAEYTEPKGTW